MNTYSQAIVPHLRTANKGDISAPHKPILLLAVLQAYENGWLTLDEIRLTPELIWLFKEIWGLLVDTTVYEPNISYPFYHLSNDKFWHLVTKPGFEDTRQLKSKAKSLSSVNAAIDYAFLDKDLALKLLNPINRAQMVDEILSTYFSFTRHRYDPAIQVPDLLYTLDEHLMNTPAKQYQEETAKLLKDKKEEAIILRGAAFKKYIPIHYNYTCAITRWGITTARRPTNRCLYIVLFSFW